MNGHIEQRKTKLMMRTMKDKRDSLIWQDKIDEESMEFTKGEIMAKLIATIDENQYPHLSFITSNIAISPKKIKWGEFVRGKSKGNVVKRPKQGFLYMNINPPFKFLQAKAKFDHDSESGEDAEEFNQMKLFRYNTYMRVYRVFFNKLISARRLRKISILGLAKGALFNLFGVGEKTGLPENRLNDVGNRLFSKPFYPKFISYLDPSDGYPVIFPIFQARAVEKKKIVIPFTDFKRDLQEMPERCKVSMFALDFEGLNQMLKGSFTKISEKKAVVDIDIVYNSMPPIPGRLYPQKAPIEKVENFSL